MAGWLQAAWTWMAFDVSGSSAPQSWYNEMMGIMMMNPISIIPQHILWLKKSYGHCAYHPFLMLTSVKTADAAQAARLSGFLSRSPH